MPISRVFRRGRGEFPDAVEGWSHAVDKQESEGVAMALSVRGEAGLKAHGRLRGGQWEMKAHQCPMLLGRVPSGNVSVQALLSCMTAGVGS